MSWSDGLGMVGVCFVLWAYARLQASHSEPIAAKYSAANAIGSGLILVSLSQDFNLASVFIEVAWFLISLYGLWRSWRLRRARLSSEIPSSSQGSVES